MLDLDNDKLEELAETIYDLKHDLGKYIKLPVAMLPKNASAEEVAEQVIRGVEETRKGPAGVLSAGVIFTRFAEEWGAALDGLRSYHRLVEVLDKAVALADVVRADPSGVSREEVERRLSAVSDAIGALLSEVEGG